MTIKEAILCRLYFGKASMNDIDRYVLLERTLPIYPRTTIRARVYELLKAKKVRRVRKGVYALAKKIRRSKTEAELIQWSAPHQDPTSW